MPRKSDAHKWVYAELPPVAGDEHPRPAQRCARCGLVRRVMDGFVYYIPSPLKHLDTYTEPPCEPKEERNAGA